tara:strand:+ start:225 stop:479 length:255 start_codon:yes stop_codon:yes gene_type:complete
MNYKFFAAFIMLLYSCGNSGPSACDCAEKTISIKSEFFKNLEISDDEKKLLINRAREELAPCDEKIRSDSIFKKNYDICLKKNE